MMVEREILPKTIIFPLLFSRSWNSLVRCVLSEATKVHKSQGNLSKDLCIVAYSGSRIPLGKVEVFNETLDLSDYFSINEVVSGRKPDWFPTAVSRVIFEICNTHRNCKGSLSCSIIGFISENRDPNIFGHKFRLQPDSIFYLKAYSCFLEDNDVGFGYVTIPIHYNGKVLEVVGHEIQFITNPDFGKDLVLSSLVSIFGSKPK